MKLRHSNGNTPIHTQPHPLTLVVVVVGTSWRLKRAMFIRSITRVFCWREEKRSRRISIEPSNIYHVHLNKVIKAQATI